MEDGPFRYHLELTPEQLKITHTALRSMIDDFGHDETEVVEIIRSVLDKLPDDHAMRAIRIGDDAREAEPDADVVEIRPDDDGSAA